MQFVIYIYSNKSPATELLPFRCPRCARIIFRHNSHQLLISNAFGVSYQELQPGAKDDEGVPIYTEFKCHSCKSVFKIMYQ